MNAISAASFTVLPLSPIRKVIAASMTAAKQTIPHFRLVADFEMDGFLALRQGENAAHPDHKISINDCLIKACASALMQHPAVNVQMLGEEIHQYSHADIAVVIAVDGGLSTPVVRHANDKTPQQIASEVKELASRAPTGKLKRREIEGGTFSISNLGMYGVDQFDAIINPPQCAILAVGCAKPRLVISPDHTTRIATLMRVTLSVDHRAIDGATAAKFMNTLRQAVEQPQSLFAR